MDEHQAEVHLRSNPGGWGDGAGGSQVSWTDASADAFTEAATRIADSGVLLMLSRSQDGGALMVAFMDDGQTERRWFHNADDAVSALAGLADHVEGRPASSPPPKRQGRNGQRSRKRP